LTYKCLPGFMQCAFAVQLCINENPDIESNDLKILLLRATNIH